MKKLIIRGAMLIAVLTLAVLCQGISFAHAASNDQISGILQDGSNKNAPLANQSVTLQMAQKTTTRDVKNVKTDDHGTFTFSGLDTDQTISYVVYMSYQGAQYTSSAVVLGNKPTQNVNLRVYEATRSTQNVAVVQSTVLIQQPDTATGTVAVSEAISFQNLNNKTYVGSLDASHGKPNALLFSLPAGVRNITLGNGFTGYQVVQVTNGFATNAALMPGASDFSFSYEIPYHSSSYVFNSVTQYPTVVSEFLVDPALHASSSALTSTGIVNADQRTYHAYKATGLTAQTTINVTLDGLPTPANNATSPSFNPTLIWLIATIIVMLAIIVVTLFLYRSRRNAGGRQRAQRDRTTSKAGSAHESGSDDVSDQEKAAGSSDERQQALLEELLALDKAYEAGTLKKASYEERRGKVKARLRVLLSEQEATRR